MRGPYEAMCGEWGCPLCLSHAEFDARLREKEREDRRAANLMLGLPEDFGIDRIDV